MQIKKAIIDFIFENANDFQLVNNTTDKFREYIYDTKGNYLIGGELISDFIRKEIDLIVNIK